MQGDGDLGRAGIVLGLGVVVTVAVNVAWGARGSLGRCLGWCLGGGLGCGSLFLFVGLALMRNGGRGTPARGTFIIMNVSEK